MAIATKVKTNTPIKSSSLPDDFLTQIANNISVDKGQNVNHGEKLLEMA